MTDTPATTIIQILIGGSGVYFHNYYFKGKPNIAFVDRS